MTGRACLAGIAILAWATAASAEVQFDQLSSCQSLTRALSAAHSSSRSCRTPATELERAITTSIAPMPGVDVCWLLRPPSEALSRFECLRTKLPETKGRLDCIASADAGDLADYQEQFREQYAARAATYLAEASACPIGNGNASRAVRSVFMGPLNNISRFELGFALQLGTGVVGTGMAIHGYASVDPDIGSDDAIEFLTVWRE